MLNGIINIYDMYFTIFWLSTLIITGMFWSVINRLEQRQKQFLLKVNTEYYQNEVFVNFIEMIKEKGKETLLKENFINYLLNEFISDRKFT